MQDLTPAVCTKDEERRQICQSSVACALRTRRTVGVERLDHVGVLLLDRPALELQRRRELVAGGLPVGVEDAEPLDPLRTAEVRVRSLDTARDLFDDHPVAGELRERAIAGERRR